MSAFGKLYNLTSKLIAAVGGKSPTFAAVFND